MNNIKVTVTDVGGSYRDVADAARTTIGCIYLTNKEGK